MSEARYEAPGTIVLRELARTLGSYRRAIAISLATIAALLLLVAVYLSTFAGASQRTTLRFRLTFRGADAGKLPNGTPFDVNEILATPSVARVYEKNDLGRFLAFDDLRGSLFVLEANDEVTRLLREYEPRLADPRLTPADRKTLETELDSKRASLGHASYALTLLTHETTRRMPAPLRAKVLSDILGTWAESSIRDKGVLLFDIAMPARDLFDERSLQSYDHLIALDLFRTRIESVMQAIDQLRKVPGANAVRTGPEQASLAEIRARLAEILDLQLGPLYAVILDQRLTRGPTELRDYLQMRLLFTELQTHDGERHVESLRAVLREYAAEAPAVAERANGDGSNVVQGVDGNLIESLGRLSSRASEVAYRQKLTDEIKAASMTLLPLRTQAEFYAMLLARTSATAGGTRQATAAEAAELQRSMASALRTANELSARTREVHATLSRTLSPSALLYQVTDPPLDRRESPYSPRKLGVAGFFVLLMATPFVLAACLLYDRRARRPAVSAAADTSAQLEPA